MKKHISFSLLIATWFKTGLIPPILFKGMAGTYGSFFAIPLCYVVIISSKYLAFKSIPGSITEIISAYFILYVIPTYLIGLLIVPLAEKELGPQTDWKGKTKTRDQNQIVIDEVLGMLISCIPILFVPKILFIHFILAFVLFRIFDIIKIPPVNFFDKMKSPSGVMLDDAIAGIYSAICVEVLILYVL